MGEVGRNVIKQKSGQKYILTAYLCSETEN